jgi:RimJ/RimL family protein N-acetyltransferase
MSVIETRSVALQSGPACLIRTAEAADARALLALVRTSLAGPYLVSTVEEFDGSESDEVRWIEDHRERDGHVAIVAEVNGAVIGLLNFRNGERVRIAHRGAFGLTVEPRWHRVGVGSALLEALLGWACAHPTIKKVGLAVQADNSGAIALYEKHGFVIEGRRIREIRLGPGDYRDDLLMYRLL